MPDIGQPRFGSYLKKHLVHIQKNLFINPSDPTYYEKVLQYMDPTSPEAHFNLGKKCEKAGRTQKALYHYTEATKNDSSYYFEAKKAAANLRKMQKEHQTAGKPSAKPRAWIMKTLITTLILFNLILLLLLVFLPKEHPLTRWNGEGTVPVHSSLSAPDLTSTPQLPPPLTQFGANLVRTALQAYIADQGQAPANIQLLLLDYPNNYLSFIPNEAVSDNNQIVTRYDGKGGWVYDAKGDTPSALFYPNLPETFSEIPFDSIEILISKADYRLVVKSGIHTIYDTVIGHGNGGSTPLGTFEVQDRVWEPLGKQPYVYGKAGLGMGELAIHGTGDPQSIGSMKSLGCIRLLNSDIIDLFPLTPQGTKVHILNRLPEEERAAQLSITQIRPINLPKHVESAGDFVFDWLG
jgi:hypothetical protein